MSINCIRALLEDAVQSHSDKTAVVFDQQSISYGELFNKVNQVACYLTELDLPKNARIGVYSNKCIEQVIAILGILSTDYVLVPLTKLLKPEQVEYIINSDGRSAAINMNGRDISSASGRDFSLIADIDAAQLAGAQIAEVTLTVKSGGQLIGVTRVIKRWK